MNLDEKTKTVEMGCETVTIEKLYGPLIFCDVRVTADFKTCKWIVERQWIHEDNSITWEKMCEFDGQESIFFD